MSWHEAGVRTSLQAAARPRRAGTALRLTAALGLAALTAGCFQPLYGERSVGAGPSVVTAMRGVDVAHIDAPNGSPEARLAVEVRDQLLFGLTGGAAAGPQTHRLRIRLTSSNAAVIVDPVTGRTDVGNYRLTATYDLVDISISKQVLQASTTTQVSFDIPGQQQRFARQRGQRDAENRAAKVIAEDIRARVAAFFISGT